MRIVIVGAGVQGTVFAVQLTRAGHQVTLIFRPERAIELRREGAPIQSLATKKIWIEILPVLESLPPTFVADICVVTVRREQTDIVLSDRVRATAIPRVVFLVSDIRFLNVGLEFLAHPDEC